MSSQAGPLRAAGLSGGRALGLLCARTSKPVQLLSAWLLCLLTSK